jgi:hypothetical protein
MKRVLTLIILSIITINLISIVSGVDADANLNERIRNQNNELKNSSQGDIEDNSRNELRIQNAIQKQNRINARENVTSDECPSGCRCQGSTTQCLINGTREMTIRAGNSGNIIMQTKGINASTNVTLYHHEGKIFAQFKNNETREIILPDEASENARARFNSRIEIENVTLDNDGNYEIRARKQSRLLWLIPVKERVEAQINAETGEIVRARTSSWWGFLARDSKSEEE